MSQQSSGVKSAKRAVKGKTDSSRYSVPVVKSTFRILEELSRSNVLNLNELTVRTGIPKSTVFRVLSTLVGMGYVLRDPNRAYMLSRKLSELVNDSAWVETLRRSALPAMLRLRDAYGETVNLGFLQFDKVVYLEVVPSEFALRLHERPGATVHAHASAIGKAILAFSAPGILESTITEQQLEKLTPNTIITIREFKAEIQRVKRKGVAFDREETSPLATCVGVPILDKNGFAIAAISISGPASRFQPKSGSPVIISLQKAAQEIAIQLKP